MHVYIYYLSLLVALLASGVVTHNNPYRLPETLQPQHYDLRILTHLSGPDELRFEGLVKIKFKVLQETKNITLHAKNLTIDESEISLSSQDGLGYSISNIALNETREFYILQLAETLQLAELYELIIPFKGPLNANDTGYYWSSFNDTTTGQKNYLAVTQFSPTFARLAFPCFDEPHLRATFRITLGYHRNYTGQSNTPVSKCYDHDSLANYVWCEHEPLFSTSTYLVAYAVHNLTAVPALASDTVHNVSFRSWMQPSIVGDSEFCVHFAPKVLGYLEKLLEFTFPLQKVDQLAVPTHKFSAMENWGLVTFQELKFVHNETLETQQVKERKASTVAHEYAHQWFGNLVAIKWWRHLWLKEGPSTYFGYLTLEALMPEWASLERNIANDLAMFFEKDMYNNSIAIIRDVDDSKSILEQFSPYVYEKGSLTMRMLHKLLGDKVFFGGIRNYLRQHAFHSVFQSDLWQAMQEAANIPNLATIMDSWTLQEGYPLVSVSRDYATATVRVNQTRFGQQNGKKNCWWIPLTFVGQQQRNFEDTRPQFWLECPSSAQTFELLNKPSPEEWIILNPQVNSIYRVDYDERNWRLIIDTLKSDENFDQIHVLNRAQLLDDILMLAGTNPRQSYELAFSMLEYLPREQKLLPWQRVLDVLNSIGAILRDEQANKFRLFMKQLIAPLYRSSPNLDSPQIHTKSSPTIALYRLAYDQACRYQVDDCIGQALRLTKGTKEDTDISVNYRDIVLCTSIEHGNQMQFEAIVERFKNSSVEAKRSTWAANLGCSRDFGQLRTFLDYLLQASDKTTNRYYIQTVNAALQRQHVAPQTAEHILQHARVLNEKFSSKELKKLLLTIIGNSHSQLEEQPLRQQLKGLNKFEEHLQAALDMRNTHRRWLKERAASFVGALSKYL